MKTHGPRLASVVAGWGILAALWPAAMSRAQEPISVLPPESAILFDPQQPIAGEAEIEDPFDDPIETDRDSFTRSPRTVGLRGNAFEAGYTFFDQPDAPEGHILPDFLARYGVTERVEVRLGWNFEAGKFAQLIPEEPEDEADGGVVKDYRINYGLKFQTSLQEGWRPESALVLTGYTPTGGDFTTTNFSAEYVFGWELENEWELDGQIRYFYLAEDGDHFNEWAPSVVIKKNFCRRWNAHIEYFGLMSDGRAEESSQHYVSPGVHYLITPDIEVGLRLGAGVNDQSANFFSNVGVGWRF